MLNSLLENKKRKIEKVLRDIVSDISAQDSLINKIVDYSIFSLGKRLRPLITLCIYKMLSGTKGNIYTCAATTELLHVATLMLDDLPCMDDSEYRRGKLSSHKKFGEANTTLVAFGLAVESMRILSDKNNFKEIKSDMHLTMLQEILQRIGMSGLIVGQIADLNQGASLIKQNNDEEKLQYITNNKTAVLFEVCALIACCLAETQAGDTKSMVTYANNIGLALQIVDDLQDSEEDKGLSFATIYGVDKAIELLHQKIKICCDCITYNNEYGLLLQQLPKLLLEI